MPRRARNRSSTGVYHVIVRGVNRQEIFRDNEDRRKYLFILTVVMHFQDNNPSSITLVIKILAKIYQ